MDSGGDAGFGGTRGKVRTKLRKFIPLSGGGGGGGRGGTRQTRGGGRGGSGGGTVMIPDDITPTIPEIMNGIFDQVFTAPELIYYLQRMAHFIQLTGDEDFPAKVGQDFGGVTPNSVFPSLQRRIRLGAPGNAASDREGSDSHVRALHAFQAGSSKWARDVTKAGDIVGITLQVIAKATSKRIDTELPKCARAILEEYVEQVVSSLIGGDPSLLPFGDKMRKEYRAKLDAFFAEFKDGRHWVESRIPVTMKSFPEALK